MGQCASHLSALLTATQHGAVLPVVQIQLVLGERLVPLTTEDAQAGTTKKKSKQTSQSASVAEALQSTGPAPAGPLGSDLPLPFSKLA